MPKTRTRYPQVISAAITQELYDLILEDVKQQDSRMSAVIRGALEESYGVHSSQRLTIIATIEQVAALRELGIQITEQE